MSDLTLIHHTVGEPISALRGYADLEELGDHVAELIAYEFHRWTQTTTHPDAWRIIKTYQFDDDPPISGPDDKPDNARSWGLPLYFGHFIPELYDERLGALCYVMLVQPQAPEVTQKPFMLCHMCTITGWEGEYDNDDFMQRPAEYWMTIHEVLDFICAAVVESEGHEKSIIKIEETEEDVMMLDSIPEWDGVVRKEAPLTEKISSLAEELRFEIYSHLVSDPISLKSLRAWMDKLRPIVESKEPDGVDPEEMLKKLNNTMTLHLSTGNEVQSLLAEIIGLKFRVRRLEVNIPHVDLMRFLGFTLSDTPASTSTPPELQEAWLERFEREKYGWGRCEIPSLVKWGIHTITIVLPKSEDLYQPWSIARFLGPCHRKVCLLILSKVAQLQVLGYDIRVRGGGEKLALDLHEMEAFDADVRVQRNVWQAENGQKGESWDFWKHCDVVLPARLAQGGFAPWVMSHNIAICDSGFTLRDRKATCSCTPNCFVLRR